MLSNISWGEFITVIVFIIACYYTVIAFLYYKQEIVILFNKRHSKNLHQFRQTLETPVNVMGATGELQTATDHSKFQPQPLSENVITATAGTNEYKEVFTDIQKGIKVLLSGISRKENPLDELRIVVPAFLEQYGQIAESSYRSKVNDFILEQCHNHFSFDITEDEINDLW